MSCVGFFFFFLWSQDSRFLRKSGKTQFFPGVHQISDKISYPCKVSSGLIEKFSLSAESTPTDGADILTALNKFVMKWLRLSGKNSWFKQMFPRYRSKGRCPGYFRNIYVKILLAMLKIPISKEPWSMSRATGAGILLGELQVPS